MHAPVPPQQTMPIADIKIGNRFRHDLGNINSLAANIADVGLLHPPVVRPDGTLAVGHRRIAAYQQLGQTEIPVTVDEVKEIVQAELAENAHRKDYSPSEIDAIRRAIEPVEQAAAKERQRRHGGTAPGKHSGKISTSDAGKVRDKIGKFAGISGKTLGKIAEVCDAARADPERYGHLVERMDRNGKVEPTYRKFKNLQTQQHLIGQAAKVAASSDRYRLFCSDFRAITEIKPASVDWIITDLPYQEQFLPLFDDLGRLAMRWLVAGGSVIIMVGLAYLPEIITALERAASRTIGRTPTSRRTPIPRNTSVGFTATGRRSSTTPRAPTPGNG
jgi:ParB-like chromosome segregation protein Spo0J